MNDKERMLRAKSLVQEAFDLVEAVPISEEFDMEKTGILIMLDDTLKRIENTGKYHIE